MTELNPMCPRCKKRRMAKNGIHRATGKQQWVCRKRKGGDERQEYCYATLDPSAPYRDSRKRAKKVEDVRKPFRKVLDVKQTLVFTAAQNATPMHQLFYESLQQFCADQDAELNIIPLRYRNPTSRLGKQYESDEHWLVPRKHMFEQRKKLNNNLVVVGDVKIQPTAGDPLTGMDGMTHGESGIYAHTKLRMKCVPTPQNKWPKILTTTGAITVPNYTDSKAGKKGEFHHVLGAVVVQIESPTKFHIHHINARKSDGAFIFKTKAYYSDRVEEAPPYKALVMGDAHYRFADPKVVEATFGKGGLVDTLNPEVLVWHDLLDCYFGNPHHKDNPFIKKAKHKSNFHIAKDEVKETVDWMLQLGAGRKNYVVASNHDDMFARWIIREDWKEIDPDNMEFYLETALHMARSARMSEIGAEYLDPFAYWLNEMAYTAETEVVALKRNQTFSVGGIALDNHGDQGPNGARGTVKNLSQVGAKLITGHGHSPAIQDGHTRTGTMTRLTAEYTSGPGNWLNTHCSIDGFDKRHLHTCVDGNFWI